MDFKDLDKNIYADWNDLQQNLNDGTTGFDARPIKREAAYTGKEIVKQLEDSVWAGSNLLNEELELEQNIQSLVDEDEDYKALENYLYSVGYPKTKIRSTFQDLTGIDPVKAYLDVENYPKPPTVVPMYNYGWGAAKKKKDTYYFVLPFIDRYAIYIQSGLTRTEHETYQTVKLAREALGKLVKDSFDVTPEATIIEKDIIRLISNLDIPKEVSPDFKKAYETLNKIGNLDTKLSYINNLYYDGKLEEDEHSWLYRKVTAADEDEQPDADDEAREEVSKDISKYQDSSEQKSFEEVKDEIKIPQEGFDDSTDRHYKANMRELTDDAYTILDTVIQDIQGYEISPIGQTVDLIDVKQYSAIDESHVDAGSVSFMVNIQDLSTQDEARAIVFMFIKGGKLFFSGKLKGQNNREYALIDEGLQSYFDDLTGRSLEQQEDKASNVTPLETNESEYGVSKGWPQNTR